MLRPCDLATGSKFLQLVVWRNSFERLNICGLYLTYNNALLDCSQCVTNWRLKKSFIRTYTLPVIILYALIRSPLRHLSDWLNPAWLTFLDNFLPLDHFRSFLLDLLKTLYVAFQVEGTSLYNKFHGWSDERLVQQYKGFSIQIFKLSVYHTHTFLSFLCCFQTLCWHLEVVSDFDFQIPFFITVFFTSLLHDMCKFMSISNMHDFAFVWVKLKKPLLDHVCSLIGYAPFRRIPFCQIPIRRKPV